MIQVYLGRHSAGVKRPAIGTGVSLIGPGQCRASTNKLKSVPQAILVRKAVMRGQSENEDKE